MSLVLNWSCLVNIVRYWSVCLYYSHVLVCLQEEYSVEQIQWYPMPLTNLHSCLELISSRPHGLFRILDDQTCLPQVESLNRFENIIQISTVNIDELIKIVFLYQPGHSNCYFAFFLRPPIIPSSRSAIITMGTVPTMPSPRTHCQSSLSTTTLELSPIRYPAACCQTVFSTVTLNMQILLFFPRFTIS